MKEIARLAKVSLGTVSHVLNNSAKVREPLRQRVLDVVASLNYQPNQLARGLRRDKTNIIGMIIPDITNPFFPAVVRGAEDAAFGSGYRLVLCNADNDPSKEIVYMNELKTYLPAGLIVIPSSDSEITLQADRFQRDGSVVVCIDRMPQHWKGDSVTVANEDGAMQATQHLVHLGHRRVATVTGPLHLAIAKARLAGFRMALKKGDLQVPADFVQESTFDSAGGYSAALRLLQMHPRPTAILAQNDVMAMGVLRAARELRLACPEDVSIFGFDGLEVTELLDPPLSSVVQPGYELGRLGVQTLIARVNDGARSVEHLVLPTELRLRASVAHPPLDTAPRKKRRIAPQLSPPSSAVSS
ncbi:MAG TPA: LacI family DNA-binding transcriptional regulator [Acidobacteriaceae bacterium]